MKYSRKNEDEDINGISISGEIVIFSRQSKNLKELANLFQCCFKSISIFAIHSKMTVNNFRVVTYMDIVFGNKMLLAFENDTVESLNKAATPGEMDTLAT